MGQYPTKIIGIEDSIDNNLQEFIFWMQFQGWSNRTIETYSNNVLQFIEFLHRETDAETITNLNTKILFQYQHFIHSQRLKSGKPITISSIHTKLVSFSSIMSISLTI